MRKTLCILLTLLMLFPLVSCGSEQTTEPQTEETTTTVEEVTTQADYTIELATDGKTDYVILYPDEDDECYQLAYDLADQLRSVCGATFRVKADIMVKESEKEILVGATDRAVSTEIISGLHATEYTVRVVDQRLVIAGSDLSALQKALIYFKQHFLQDGKKTVLTFNTADNYTRESTYYIKSVTVAGNKLDDYTVVYPKGIVLAEYIATLIGNYIGKFYGAVLTVANDSKSYAHEIRVGDTARTQTTCESGSLIAVKDGNLELVTSNYTGWGDLYFTFRKTVMSYTKAEYTFQNGDNWPIEEKETAHIARESGTIRVMYQNIWGYSYADYPTLNRTDMSLAVYQAYDPDVLCLEEASSKVRSDSPQLWQWLTSAGYAEVCYSSDGGIGNPIYYKTDLFNLVAKGYGKARSGDKGTTWVVLEEKATGKKFAVTNSHYAADTNANNDSTLGNTYRTQDAQKCIEIVNNILNTYADIPVISGGDYNSIKGSDPINVMYDGGMTQVRDLTDTWDTLKSPHHGTFDVNTNTGFYDLQSGLSTAGTSSIDHIFFKNQTVLSDISYWVVKDSIALTSSDHTAHFTDFKLQ